MEIEMRLRMRLTLLLACLALLAANATMATCGAPINARQAIQQARIHQGLHEGDLTLREGARLEARQQHVRRIESRYRANDGVLGPIERCDLNRRLDANSAQIWRQRHDRQRYR
jgi:hypothetical protein